MMVEFDINDRKQMFPIKCDHCLKDFDDFNRHMFNYEIKSSGMLLKVVF